MMARLIKFYEGGLSAEYLDAQPIPVVLAWAKEMEAIAAEMKPKR